MGNPHAIVFVDDVDALDLATVGPPFEIAPVGQGYSNTLAHAKLSNIELKINK